MLSASSRAPHPALLAMAGAVCQSHPPAAVAAVAAPAVTPAPAVRAAGCELLVHRIPGGMSEEQVRCCSPPFLISRLLFSDLLSPALPSSNCETLLR